MPSSARARVRTHTHTHTHTHQAHPTGQRLKDKIRDLDPAFSQGKPQVRQWLRGEMGWAW